LVPLDRNLEAIDDFEIRIDRKLLAPPNLCFGGARAATPSEAARPALQGPMPVLHATTAVRPAARVGNVFR